VGIDASATLEQTIDQVTRIAANTADKIGLGRPLRDDEITVIPGYEGPAYGLPDRTTVEAIQLAARTEGMLTDPVYEGKSLAGMIGMIRSGRDPGGLPGLVLPSRWPAGAPRIRRFPRPRSSRARALALTPADAGGQVSVRRRSVGGRGRGRRG
jgi:hypothetical protein